MTKRLIVLVTVFCIVFFGVVGTANADYYSDNITLKYGMRNNEVTNMQKDLKNLGYFSYYPTGYFGSLTYNAVLSFQKDNGLYADGIVGRATSREIKVDRVLQTAKQYAGVPYVWGGVSPSGFDCSGFTHYVLLKNNVTVPRSSSAQYTAGIPVARSQLRPGDLVFFTTYKPGPSHVGIYLGSNKFIHASSGADKVIVSDLTKSYYAQHYIGARRVIQ